MSKLLFDHVNLKCGDEWSYVESILDTLGYQYYNADGEKIYYIQIDDVRYNIYPNEFEPADLDETPTCIYLENMEGFEKDITEVKNHIIINIWAATKETFEVAEEMLRDIRRKRETLDILEAYRKVDDVHKFSPEMNREYCDVFHRLMTNLF